MESFWNILGQSVQMPFEYLNDPEKRVFWPYLMSSVAIALAVFYFNRKNIKSGFLSYFFKKQYWLGRSAITDYVFMFFNALIKIALIAPFMLYSMRISFYVTDTLVQFFGRPKAIFGATEAIIWFTLVSFIIKDFMSFFLHYLQHRIPVLWYFHKVHHSATELNPFTQYRIHPVELIMNNIRNILVTVFLIGIFDYLAGSKVHAYELMGVNILTFLFLATGANLRHSHVELRYPSWLEKVFISPVQHQIHHSTNPMHHNKNMGSKLALWDWMFGTLIHSKNTGKLDFGLGEEAVPFRNFGHNLASPFRIIWGRIVGNSKAH